MSVISCGSDVSTTSMSLEKRDSKRPTGVVSKKSRGVRSTPWSKFLCMITAAYKQPSCGARSQTKEVIAGNKKL